LKTRNSKLVQALSFDLDETLLNGSKFRDAVLLTCGELATRTGIDASRLSEANSKVWQSYWPQVEEKWTLGALSGTAVSEEAWRRTLLACGRDDESLVRLARDTHSQQRRNALRLFDDVHEVFNSLKPRFRMALVTNGASDTQRGSLRLLDIEHLFDAIVISGEVGVAKPDVRVFDMALQRLGVRGENAWHVGDSLKTDVAGALGAGLTAVWLNRAGGGRNEGDPKPHFEIRSLRELAPLLSGP
jgi:HAD superfamily hydrolase (TIGR01549 family)